MRLLTLNTWGAPYAEGRVARFQAICDRLHVLQPDVIALQEVFTPKQREILLTQLSEQWPYHHHFASGILGSGLMTFSRYPIVDVAFLKFRLGGKPERLKQGDFYAGKGIGLTRIKTPDAIFDVYNCHTHAQYEPEHGNEYAVYTDSNLYEAARFINARSSDRPAILCGDLNARPDQSGYRLITQLGQLTDAYLGLHGEHPTTFSAANPYVSHDNQCLDYVLLRHAKANDITLTMTKHFIGDYLAYSDHYALMAEIVPAESITAQKGDAALELSALQERLTLAIAETDGERGRHIESALFGLAGTVDLLLTLRPMLRRFGKRASKLTQIGFVGLALYALYHLLQAGVNLQGRRNVLQALHDEITAQLKDAELP